MYVVVRKSKHSVEKISARKMPVSEIVPIDSRISLDVAEVVDHHERTTAAFNRIYYISNGQMQIRVNNQHMLLEKGDAIFVEKGMTFELLGTFNVIIISHPSLL